MILNLAPDRGCLQGAFDVYLVQYHKPFPPQLVPIEKNRSQFSGSRVNYCRV